GQHYYTSPYSF
nr:immunoglobulin light chain junction region [Macaca mulatta]